MHTAIMSMIGTYAAAQCSVLHRCNGCEGCEGCSYLPVNYSICIRQHTHHSLSDAAGHLSHMLRVMQPCRALINWRPMGGGLNAVWHGCQWTSAMCWCCLALC